VAARPEQPDVLALRLQPHWRTYDISLFRIFEPEIRGFYDKMINLNPYGVYRDTALDLGSYWCNDTPGAAYLGHFEPRRMLDPASTSPSLPGPSTACPDPAYIYPILLNNMPFSAMYYAHALFSSPFDSELDMGKSMKVFVKGSYDDFPAWNSIPAEQICTVTNDLTGLEYRAIRQPTGVPDIGCRLIEKTEETQNIYLGSNGDPFRKDVMNAWFERLEFARDLTRYYDDRVILR
jgi:hypothetical protein